MNTLRKIFYSSAVGLPLAALAATGVHAAVNTTGTASAPGDHGFFFEKRMNLTDAQKAALAQAEALHKQADDILEKAGLPVRHRMMKIDLTDEQKATLEQVRKLHEEGKIEEAKALLEKAGLPPGPMGMKGMRMEWKNGQAHAGNVFFNRAVPAPDATK